VSAADFRRIALQLPQAVEAAHMGHPDFRVEGKIFASLWRTDDRGTVKLTPDQQEMLLSAEPEVFTPAAGAWGRKGWTTVWVDRADAATLESVLGMAWRNTAPPRLVASQAEAVR
jgi:hypothetical protein